MDRQEAITIFMEGSRLMQDMQFNHALEKFEMVREPLSDVPALYYNIATLQEKLGNPEIAEVEIAHALKLDDNNVKYLKLYFRTLQQTGQFSDAIALASQILKIDYDPEIKLNQAFLLLRIDEISKAVKIMEEMLNEGSHYPVLYFALGILRYQNNEYGKAQKLIEECIKFEYQKEEATTLLISILERQGKNNEAIKILEETQSKTSNSEFSLAKLYKQEDKNEEALSKIDELLAKDDKNMDYLNFKGHLLREIQLFPNAIEMYNQVLDIDNDNLSAIKGKALALVELDQHEEANALFERGERLNRGGELPKFDDLVMNLDVL